MRIKKSHLRRIIREELSKAIREQDFTIPPQQDVIDIPPVPPMRTFREGEDEEEEANESLAMTNPTRWAKEMFK